ncbi:hypothetical protein C1646_773893 [Rhizophagus diaphanus]|nr:hypothetical protein C1646_773893 [Rhizophagus diaphanus] [Rhizophagus sp. MUCL 43196]
MGSILPANQTKCETYDEIHQTMKKIKEQDAVATQIRVFLLKIPISKIPPVIIAALPTKGDVTAEEISNHLLMIIEMTARCIINLVSFGADGAITEMKAQQIVMEHPSASGVLKFKASLYGINFKAPIFNNRPIIHMQNVKHAKKTARNQIHYGIRLLTFGNSTVYYDQLCNLTEKENSALRICNVYNVNKQDDGVTFHIFHSQLLRMCQDNGKSHIEKTSENTSNEWYSIAQSFISIQSYHIFKSLAKSLVLLIISHRDYYEDYPLLPWEHRTETLEHVFGLARQLNCIDCSGYIFDFDSNNMSAEVLELLCQWLTQDEIHGAIRIVYLNAEKFARFVALSKSETSLCPFVYIDNSYLDAEQEHAEVNTAINFNPLISENDQLCNIAKEVAWTAFINQNEELRSFVNNVNDDSIFGEYDELGGLNEDLESCASRSSDQMDNLGKINSNEIIYLLNHQKSVTIPTISAESEELLFNNHNGLDVLKALIIRESHNAFSRADHLCEIQNRSAFNLDEGSQNRIERNTANEFVQNIDIPRMIPDAGVSEEYQLEDHGLVIMYIGKKLCVGQILVKYQKISDRHAYIRSNINSVDFLSFISVILYHHLSGSYFTCQSPTDGSLFVHLFFKNVVYYLGKVFSFNATNYEMLTLDINDRVWSIVKGVVARTSPHSNLLAIRDKLLYTFKEKVTSKIIVRFWKRYLDKAKEYKNLYNDMLLAESENKDSEVEEFNE